MARWHALSQRVLLLCHNNETKDAFDYFLANAFNKSDFAKLKNIAFVISRIPYELGEQSDDAYKKMSKLILEGLLPRTRQISKILKFHSDMETHMEPMQYALDDRYSDPLNIGREVSKDGDVSVQIVQLHKDILTILIAICPELVSKKYSTVSLLNEEELSNIEVVSKVDRAIFEVAADTVISKVWREMYGYDFKITLENRMFGILNGQIQNVDDHERNVAFKVKTFLNLLNTIDTTLEESGVEGASSIMDKALYNTGLQCGSAFGLDLENLWNKDKKFQEPPEDKDKSDSKIAKERNARLNQKIVEWCEFDTRAGFGKITFDPDDEIISVVNLFIIDHEITKERNYESFFNGYVIGVMGKIVSKEKFSKVKLYIEKDAKLSAIINAISLNELKE
jgi:hypothetical protein